MYPPLQAACALECKIEHALSLLNGTERCVPWYYPNVRPDVRMCSPYEAWDFNEEMENGSANCTVSYRAQGYRAIAPSSQLAAF